MNDAQFLSVAWNQLIQVSLLTVGVWLLTKLFARNRPHLAHAMWLVVLAKCVTPPLLESPTGLFGHLSVPQPVWFEPEIVVEEAIEPVIPEPRVVASNPEFESEITVDSLSQGYVLEDDSLLGQLMFEDAAFELDDELVESVAAISKPPVAEPSVTFLPLWKLWLISAGTVMSLIFLRVMCTLWRVKRQRIETPPELLELVQKLSQQFGLRRRVRVLITSSRVGPAVVGSFRPLLILPDVVTNGRSAKELEPILAHELLHVRRGDLGIGWLQVLVQSLWWFHPLVWLVNRLLNRETERCCDEAVLAELNCSPALYARCLLNVLEQKRNLTPIPAFPGVKPVELTKQRMERIMKLGQGCRKKSPWWCWLVVLLLGAVVLPGTARSQTDAVAPEKSARTTEPDSVAVEATESNTNVQEPRTARVYEVGDLLETLRDEYEFTATEAERALEHSLFNALATLEVARKLRQSSSADRLTSQNVCSGSALFAVSNKEGHRQIERLLELWKEHGFYEVTIEGCMATVPVGFLATNLPSNQRVPLEQAESGKITTPAIPSLTMSNHEFKELQELIQSDTRSNLIAFPRITIPHGTRASVMDIVQHPYIVGYKGDEPIIEVLNKGLELQLNPLVREGTVTQLDCDVKYSRLLKAERRQSRENLFEKQIEPPSPLLNVAGMNVSVLLEPGKTTLLRGLKNKSGEVEEELLVFLSATPRKLNREFLQPVADAREQPTGKLMSGTGVNSDAGVTGSLVLDERNFDLKSPLIYESGKVVEDQKLSLGLPKLNEEHENSYREQLEKLSTQLDQPWEAEYFERPLSEVLLEFHQKLGVRFVIDRDRIAAAGLSEESPVNLSLSGVSLRSIMKMVMAVKLAYCTIPVIDRESGSVTPTLLISNRKEIIRLALLMKSQSIPNFNSIEDLQVKAPGEKHRFIEKQLDQPIAVKFEQTKFTNAFKLIANRLRFTIYIDISSLPEGMTTDALIKDYESANETTLREVLDEICTPHGLIYLIEDEVLKIVGKEWYEQQPVTMVYPWTPRTLNWEDGAWKLDFSSDPTDSPERRGVQEATRKSAAHKTDDQNARLIAKIYPVADLVIPIPGAESDPVKDDPILSKLPDQSELFKVKKKPLSVSAQPLIDLIQKSIEPESWTGDEAVGTIAFHEQTLSIVIRHTEPVHEKVSELLTALRRKQDLQVTLECLTVQFEKNSFSDFWTNVGIEIEHLDANAKNSMKPLIFHGVKRDDFRSKIDQFEAAQVLSFPKLTVFNGIGAQIQISGAGADEDSVPMMHYMIVPTISEDRRTIDVKFAVNPANTLDALTKAKSMTIHDGKSVLIEVTDELLSGQNRTGVPEVDKALRELKKKELGLRTFVLLTPRIIIQEEEEELLNIPLIIEEEEEPLLGIPQSEAAQPAYYSNTRIGTATPRIIVQEEEEALLGLPQPEAEPTDRAPAPVPANPSP